MSHLAKRLAKGDSEAFAELYDLCGDRLHHFLTSKLFSREDANDVLQEVFLRLVQKRKVFHSVENPVAYAYQVARNEANGWLARSIRSREQYGMLASDLFVEFASADSKSAEWCDELTKALTCLSDESREVIVLKIYSGFALRDIAEITESPLGTVATRYRRAIEKLREIVGDLE